MFNQCFFVDLIVTRFIFICQLLFSILCDIDVLYHLKTYSQKLDRTVSFYLRESSNRAILKEKGGLICMMYTTPYTSPLGTMLLAADATGLTGAWFEGQKYFACSLDTEHQERETSVLTDTKHWLDLYFRGMQPDFLPPLHPIGSAFRQSVWEILLQIPYGHTTTYGEIARQIARKQGTSHMSAQAVGGAVGHNPISILIPCHRVVGTNGSLTGYAGGIEKKIQLLTLEKCDMHSFTIPK